MRRSRIAAPALVLLAVGVGVAVWPTGRERAGDVGPPSPIADGEPPTLDAHEATEPAPAPAEAVPARRAQAEAVSTAELLVRCVDVAFDGPVQAVSIEVRAEQEEERLVLAALDDGEGSLRVPAYRELSVVAREVGGDRRTGTQRIEPLDEGTTLTVTLRLGEPYFFGRVLDARTEAPIAGAVVRRAPAYPEHGTFRPDIAPSDPPEATTDADGLFRFSREGGAGGLVTAPRYTPHWFQAVSGHTTPRDALPLRLIPGAGLEVAVVDHDGVGASGVMVRLELPIASAMGGISNGPTQPLATVWSAVTGDTGHVSIHDLPAEVALRLTLERGGTTQSETPVVLAEGMVSSRHCVFRPAGLGLSGLVVDEEGNRVPGVKVVAIEDDWEYPRLLHARDEALATATTDDRGAFELSDLSEARILIGPSPEQSGYAALGHPIVLPHPSSDAEPFVLRVQRPRSISGILIDESSRPLAGFVYAHEPGCMVGAQTDDGGVFRLLGLARGAYVVGAKAGPPDRRLESVRSLVEAGTDGLVLTIRPPGRALIHAVDGATGAPKYGMMFVAPTGIIPSERGMPGPTFMLTKPPGEYWVVVTTSGNLVGATRVAIRSEETTHVELALSPAALITVKRHDEGPRAFLRYRIGNDVCFGRPLHAGERRTFAVPTGTGRFELVRGSEVLFQRDVELVSADARIQGAATVSIRD